jgi:hypothetical protein
VLLCDCTSFALYEPDIVGIFFSLEIFSSGVVRIGSRREDEESLTMIACGSNYSVLGGAGGSERRDGVGIVGSGGARRLGRGTREKVRSKPNSPLPGG